MPTVNESTNDMPELKVSALTNAARISHLATEITIGPQSTLIFDENKNDTPTTVVQHNSSKEKNTLKENKWHKNVWSMADIQLHHCPQELNENDCKRIRFKMIQNNAEKYRVRKQLTNRQIKIDEIDELMAKMKLLSIKQAAENLQRNLLEREEHLKESIRQIELSVQADVKQVEQERLEHERQKVERSIRLKREQDRLEHLSLIKSFKNLFILVFEKFVKTILTNEQYLSRYQEYDQHKNSFLARYEIILQTVNAGQLSVNEVSALEQLCDEIQLLQKQIDEEIQNNSEELLQRNIKFESSQNVEHSQKSVTLTSESVTATKSVAPESVAPIAAVTVKENTLDNSRGGIIHLSLLAQYVHPDRLQMYENLLAFLVNYEQSIKSLESDANFNKFRFNCKKAINIPLNSICAKSTQHLQDKYDKVALVLSGNSVNVGDINFLSADHPLGIKYCTLLVAKRFVNLADSEVSSNPLAAFPIAAVLVTFWQKFPDVGRLFLGYLYRDCPYLVPYYIPQLEGQTDENYLKLLGYRHNDTGIIESQEHYLKRMTGLIRLYSVVLISKSKRSHASIPNPHSLDNGWIWLSNMVNLDPLPDVSATLLQEFLAITGAEMWKQYGNQFIKLLVILQQNYLQKLNMIDEGGPKARLEVLLNEIFNENKISPPDGVLPLNFW